MNKDYRPIFHITAHKGWINDPNGFSFFGGKYHLFAQHNPFDTKWGPMHWLHFVSEDLIKWDEVGIALYPDKPYDNGDGCFSGSATEIDKKHYLVYTGVKDKVQTQCIASSTDGLNYIKSDLNPFIDRHNLPSIYDINNFRDPKIFFRHGYFYVLVGAKVKEDGSHLILFKTKDFKDVTYLGPIFEMNNLSNGMLECCDILFLNEQDDECVLFCSPQYKKSTSKYKYQNIHSTIALIGKFDFDNIKFIPTSDEIQLDYGFDFYASQTLRHDNINYLVAWQAMWDRNFPSEFLGYAGQFIVPRILKVENNYIYQYFNDDGLKKYVKNIDQIEDFKVENQCEFKSNCPIVRYKFNIQIDKSGIISLYNSNGKGFYIYIDKSDDTILFSREDSFEYIFNQDGSEANVRKILIDEGVDNLHFDILIDHSCIEILINNKYAFSALYFACGEYGVCFDNENDSNIKINNFIKYEYKETKGEENDEK